MLHAVYLSVNHGWRLWQNKPASAPRKWWSASLGLALTYVCVVVAQVFFRADSTRDALALLAGMFGMHGLGMPAGLAVHLHVQSGPGAVSAKALAVLALFPFCWLLPNVQELLGQAEVGRFEIGGGMTARIANALLWRPQVGRRLAAWGVAMAACLIAVLYYISYSTSFLYFQF